MIKLRSPQYLLVLSIAVSSLLFISAKPLGGDDLKLNQIQIIASHNSYHLRTDPAVLRFLNGLYSFGALPRDLNPAEIDYSNVSLTEQLEKYHVHGMELDIWNDPAGGRFYHRQGKAYAWKCTASKIEALKQPGFKLIHIPDFDFNSTNPTFIDALKEIKTWSDAHPNHLPLFINVEVEVATAGDQIKILPRLARAAKFDSLAAENLDREVKSVFGENLNGVLTPDNVRGTYKTLNEAVLAGNWPALSACRGKVMFIIDGDEREGNQYAKGHPSLQKRAMFVYAPIGTPEAAFVIMNGPKEDYAKIQQAVKQGYIVRTRSDAGTIQARAGDYSDMKAALSSSAQIISTDYYRPDPRSAKHPKKWSTYHVQFPDGSMARVDSISGAAFHAQKIEE